MAAERAHLALPASSFLESCFLRWVLAPAADAAIVERITPQAEVTVGERNYRIDYQIAGERLLLAVGLDGFAFHSDRLQFTYDRFRQNDLFAAGRTTGTDVAGRPMAFGMFERGDVEERVVHNEERVQARKAERAREALARKYAEYAQDTDNPITFDQYVEVMRQLAR